MRKIAFFLISTFSLCLLFSEVNGQVPTSSISGKVIDRHSFQPLIGAAVVIFNTDPFIGGTTNLSGEFTLNKVPIGRHDLKIQYLGYDDVFLTGIELNSGKELVLNIEMEEQVVTAREIVIEAERDRGKAQNELATVSSRQLSIEDSKRYAGSLNDVSRMAQNFAGVQGANDTRNDLVIRGNSSLGVLYRLDGVDIPNPNHFALMGSSGGPISILNNNVLANSDFFTGAFPAEYGNAYAGVFDLKMRNGNNTQHEFLGQIGFNGIEAMAEGPLKKGKRASYLVNYRYSTLEALKLLGISFGTLAVPQYQDMSFKINLPTTNGQTAIFGLGGISDITFLDEEKEDDDIFVQGSRNLLYGTQTGAIGISHTQLLGKSSHLKAVLSTQYAANNIVNDTLDVNGQNPFNTYTNESGRGKQSLGLIFSKKFSSRHFVKAGAYTDRLFFQLDEKFWSTEAQSYFQQADFNGATYLIQPFAHWQFKVTPKLTFNSGLHGQYFAFNGATALEPRIGALWKVNPRHSFSAAYGSHSQLPPIEIYFTKSEGPLGQVLQNKNLGFIKSNHLVVGYDFKLNPNTRIKTEVYHQALGNIPVDAQPGTYSVLNQGANFYFDYPEVLVNEGTGTNYGIEFTLERFLHKGFYYLLTASLFESKYVASDGNTYNTAFNGNYNFTGLVGFEQDLRTGKSEESKLTFTSNARFTLNGGQRYTPFNVPLSQLVGTGVFDQSRTFAERFEDYWRADARFGIKRNGHKVTHELAIELQNITARQNIFTIQYNPEKEVVEELYQLGFLPLAQYRVYF